MSLMWGEWAILVVLRILQHVYVECRMGKTEIRRKFGRVDYVKRDFWGDLINLFIL